VVAQVAGGLRVPPGGVVLDWQGKQRRVDALPARIVIDE
jgi:hypothetical protein